MRVLVACVVAIILAACGRTSGTQTEWEQWVKADGKARILCTTAMIDDIVKAVGGDHLATLVLIQGELDPHSYELVKGDDEKLYAADIVFYNGLGLEHAPSLRHHLETHRFSVPVGDRIGDQVPDRIIFVDGQPDPHIWTDIELWARTIDPIVDALSRLLPDFSAEFKENGELKRSELLAKHRELLEMMGAIPLNRRYLVSSHDAFNYFARVYLAPDDEQNGIEWQKRCESPEGLSPEGQLSSLDIRRITDHLAEHGINVIFSESNVSQDSLRKITAVGREKGLSVVIARETLYGDAMGAPGSDGDTYIKMIEHNARVIAHYLNGQNNYDESP